jgi:hypothetical protein
MRAASGSGRARPSGRHAAASPPTVKKKSATLDASNPSRLSNVSGAEGGRAGREQANGAEAEASRVSDPEEILAGVGIGHGRIGSSTYSSRSHGEHVDVALASLNSAACEAGCSQAAPSEAAAPLRASCSGAAWEPNITSASPHRP